MLAFAVMETLTGHSLAGHGKTVDRADNPKKFRGNVAVSYAAGIFFVGRYIYQLISK
jgi:hypothetical protein